MTTKHSPEIEQFLGAWLPLAALKTRGAAERHLRIDEMARTGSIELAAAAHLLLVQEGEQAETVCPRRYRLHVLDGTVRTVSS